MTSTCPWAILLVLALSTACVAAQPRLRLEKLYDLPLTRSAMPMTMRSDSLGRSVLYVAVKDDGLRIYDLSGSPTPVCTLRAAAFKNMHVMNLAQDGERLYVALGNHWGASSGAGLAVVDVHDPRHAAVLGLWREPTHNGAGGAVVVNGPVAYLAAMGQGVWVLDISNPKHIQVLSHFEPELTFPDARPDRKKINARGLALRGSHLFLCFDAGGVRVIDVADPRHLAEIGRYSNPAMNGKPRAYNNIVLDGQLAYVTADYVGVEVLDVSDLAAIRLLAWWNPWNPRLSGWNWFGSKGHANEVAFDQATHNLYVAAGKSDLVVLNVTDPAHPIQVGGYGDVDDKQATWGVSRYGDRVYLSYICTLGIPFLANWPGLRALRVCPDPAPRAGTDQ
jgi:hypothetical protein